MKARNVKDYTGNWVQTVVSVLGLLFTILVGFGVVTPEQSTQGLPIAVDTVTAISTAIAGVVSLIGIFFKPSA